MIEIRTNFDKLLNDLRSTSKNTNKAVDRGLRTGARDAQRFAIREAVEATNSKGKTGSRGSIAKEFRQKAKRKVSGNQATLTFIDRTNRSLARYAVGKKSPAADYRGSGVTVDHYGRRKIFTREAAFIRNGSGGGLFMAEREGSGSIGETYHAKPLSRAAIHPDVAEPAVGIMRDRVFTAVDRAFVRG